MGHAVALIPGDGIGPEVVGAARRTLEATGVGFDWDEQEAGARVAAREGTPVPPRVVAAIRAAGVALRGPLAAGSAVRSGSANVTLRRELGLSAGIRICTRRRGVRSRYEDVDIVVIRELTEDTYTGIEFEMGDPDTGTLIGILGDTTGARLRHDTGISIKAISASASERIARFAFAYAGEHGRRKVTVGHKANIMKFSDGVFLEGCRRVASEHPDVVFEERIIDALSMQLVQRPQDFDVLVLPNLYGDLVSELCAGLVGGPGVVPSADVGDDVAVFGSLHGCAFDYEGTDRADPTAMLLAGAMLLRHLGEGGAADRVERAVDEVIAEGRSVTFDLDRPGDVRPVGTSEMTDAVVARIEARAPHRRPARGR